MSINAFRQLITEGSELGVDTIDLTGGEPLFHPQFKDMLEFIAQHSFRRINISTNLTLLDDDHVRLFTLKNFVCNISLDGSSQLTVDQIRGKGKFNLIVKNISKLKKNEIPFSLRFSINKLNKNEICGILKLGKNLDAPLEISPTQIAGNADTRLALSIQDKDQICRKIKKYSACISPQTMEESFTKSEKCDGGDPGIISVNVDGIAVSCLMAGIKSQRFADNIPLKKMWLALLPEKRKMKRFKPIYKKCMTCNLRAVCYSGCNITAINNHCLELN